MLVVTPYYNKPPQRGIVAHFQAVAAATDLPVIAYNIPGRCVINIEPETMTELAQIPNVKAVKQSNADLDQARHIVELGLDLYAGDDNLVLPFVELGGLGGVCVHTHVVGPQVKEMVQRFRAGDVEAARQLDDELAAGLRADRRRHRADPDQGRAQPARPRRRRRAAAARRGERGRGRADPLLPRAAAPARASRVA